MSTSSHSKPSAKEVSPRSRHGKEIYDDTDSAMTRQVGHVDSDDDTISVDEEFETKIEDAQKHSLLGQVVVFRPYRTQSVTEGLLKAWHAKHEVEVIPMAEDKFLFHFTHIMDLQNVLLDGPWSVNGNLLLLQQWSGRLDVALQYFDIWIQIHDLPFDLRQPEFIIKLSSKLGDVLQVIETYHYIKGVKHVFYRCRITLDVGKPLKQCLYVKRRGGFKTSVPLLYERVPLFCAYCGMIDHDVKQCIAFFDDQKIHMSIHGCVEHDDCPVKPGLKFNHSLKGLPPFPPENYFHRICSQVSGMDYLRQLQLLSDK